MYLRAAGMAPTLRGWDHSRWRQRLERIMLGVGSEGSGGGGGGGGGGSGGGGGGGGGGKSRGSEKGDAGKEADAGAG